MYSQRMKVIFTSRISFTFKLVLSGDKSRLPFSAADPPRLTSSRTGSSSCTSSCCSACSRSPTQTTCSSWSISWN